jgi:hypothetical protein
MSNFQPEYFILLTDSELSGLVSAQNRNDYQPGLKAYLSSSRRLKELRRLAFPTENTIWKPPVLTGTGSGEIIDAESRVRGRKEVLPLPARPGEPQMALSHDWFWDEFSVFLRRQGLWPMLSETQLEIIRPAGLSLSVEKIWTRFWLKLSSLEHLKRSVALFLNNKTLFKNQAKAWGVGEIPIVSEDMARFLIGFYERGGARKRLFKERSLPKSIDSLKSLLYNPRFTGIPLPKEDHNGYVQGGDCFKGRKAIACLGCGAIVPRKESYERLALFVKDADERPQSGKVKDDKPEFCPRCVATVFLCPVKLTPETLTVRFDSAANESHPASAIQNVQEHLRKYVAQTLHVVAGSFVSLHTDEWVDGKQRLFQYLGAYHYALWKMAATFPPELFSQGFGVRVYPGEETFSLPPWLLQFTSSLVHWEGALQYQAYREKGLKPHFSQFLRLITGKRIFQGFYTLLRGDVVKNYSGSWRINRLQEIWSQLEIALKKEEPMPIPDYPKIAGFTGLLLPLAERVDGSSKTEREKKRAVGKLLEEVDRPLQYAYTAARESGSREFIFCKWPRNRYFFEKAIELLQWAGEDVSRLKAEGERIVNGSEAFAWARSSEEKLFIGPDQVARVTSALVCENEKPYENEADWRAFAYQAKLALWSMFPQHLGSDKQD